MNPEISDMENALLKEYKIRLARYLREKKQLIKKEYSEQSILKIILTFPEERVALIIQLHDELIKKLTHDEIINLASTSSGDKILVAVNQYYEKLKALGFDHRQIYNMAVSKRGVRYLEYVNDHTSDLLAVYKGTSHQNIVDIAACKSPCDKLKLLMDHFRILTHLPFRNLFPMVALLKDNDIESLFLLTQKYDFLNEHYTPQEIVDMVSRGDMPNKIKEAEIAKRTRSELELQMGSEPEEASYQKLIDTGVYFFKPYVATPHYSDKKRRSSELQQEQLPPRKVNP